MQFNFKKGRNHHEITLWNGHTRTDLLSLLEQSDRNLEAYVKSGFKQNPITFALFTKLSYEKIEELQNSSDYTLEHILDDDI